MLIFKYKKFSNGYFRLKECKKNLFVSTVYLIDNEKIRSETVFMSSTLRPTSFKSRLIILTDN